MFSYTKKKKKKRKDHDFTTVNQSNMINFANFELD